MPTAQITRASLEYLRLGIQEILSGGHTRGECSMEKGFRGEHFIVPSPYRTYGGEAINAFSPIYFCQGNLPLVRPLLKWSSQIELFNSIKNQIAYNQLEKHIKKPIISENNKTSKATYSIKFDFYFLNFARRVEIVSQL